MKFSECNVRQKKAWRNIKYAAIDYIFGLENVCQDNPKDSNNYHDYLNSLLNLDSTIDMVYHQAITCVCDEGFVGFGDGAERYLKDIRFCGKDFLMRIVTKYCQQYRAEALSSLGVSNNGEAAIPHNESHKTGMENQHEKHEVRS